MVTMCHNTNSTEQCPNVKSSLNLLRKRRHLTFPDKSNIVVSNREYVFGETKKNMLCLIV